MQTQKFRDEELDLMIRDWVEKVVGEPVNRQLAFSEVFKDGILLCKVINKIKPGSIPKINTGKLPFHKMENIGKYIEACKKIGMGGDKLFTTPDLFEEKKLSLVKFNIYSLGMHAQTVMNWTGPGLEQLKPPDPINLVDNTPEQIRSPRSKNNKADQSTESKPSVAPDQITSDTLDLSLKEAFKYNPELEKCARDWIEEVVGQPLSHPSLAASLRDGITLCKLLNIIQPGTVPKINTDSRNKFKCLENIVAYIKGCQGMGFPTDHIFDPADLFEEKNLNLVLSNIQTMGTVFSPKVAGNRLPIMKTPSSAPSFYSSLIQADDSTSEDHALGQELLRWVNLTLGENVGAIEDLKTGLGIIKILEKLTKQSVGYYEKEPSQPFHFMQNVVCILRFIGEQTGTALRYPTRTDLLLGRLKPLNTLLSFIREKFDQDFRYKDVTHNERRSHILAEILETEETYVTMLSKVHQWMIKPLQKARNESAEILTEEEEKEIFSNLSDILDLHQNFVNQLSRRIKDPLPVISDLFSTYKPQFVQLYIEYVKNFDSVYVMIKFIKKKKKQFKELIKAFELEQAKTNALDLGSFLILPVQRLPRYMLLLAELEKFTEDEHPDKKGLQKAIEDVKETLDILDKSKCANEVNMTSNQKISAISRNIELDDFELVHPQRRYIREGPVKMDPEDPNPYTFLFNDVILYTEHRTEIPPDDPYARQFKYVTAVPLSFCEGVRESADDPCVFELLLEEGETMSFYCRSVADCKSWVDDVRAQHALGITLDFQ